VLPYWNWSDPSQRGLPDVFRLPNDPSNALFVPSPGRPVALNNGSAQLPAGAVDPTMAFSYKNFLSPANSGLTFGGQEVPPSQFNSPHGELESLPHDAVHGALGGLMANVDTAALDPIFWLHHANIDRLWNQWAQQGGVDPINDSAWMDPTTFQFFDEAGHAVYLTGRHIIDTVSEMNYRYDDDPTIIGQSTGARIQLSNASVAVAVPLPESATPLLNAILDRRIQSKIILRLSDIQYDKPE